mgnify:CR=1 FL=1
MKDIKGLGEQSKIDFNFTLSQLSFDGKNYPDALKTVKLIDAGKILDPEKREKFNVFLSEVYEKNGEFDKALSILENSVP